MNLTKNKIQFSKMKVFFGQYPLAEKSPYIKPNYSKF